MNLFRLSDCPIEAAKLNQDLHVKKIMLECTQMLANCYSPFQLLVAPKTQEGNVRRYSHPHHPMSKYVKHTSGNYKWALAHGVALCDEYKHRFNKEHFCEGFIRWSVNNSPELVSDGDEEEFPQCFKQYPQCEVKGNPVEGYKNYYRVAKRQFLFKKKIVLATWTKRDIPDWF